MNKARITFILFFSFYCILSHAQNAIKVVLKKADNPEVCIGSLELNSDKYVVAGNNTAKTNNNTLFATDSNGNLHWYHEFSYRNFSSSDFINTLVSDSNNNIYCGGEAAVWNSLDPVLYKFSPGGELLFDSAYKNNTGFDNTCSIGEMVNIKLSGRIFSVSTVVVGSTGKINIQEFDYTGGRIRNQFLTTANKIFPVNFFLTDSGKTISMFCDSANEYLFFLKMDTSGNILIRKKLAYIYFGSALDTKNKSFLMSDGRFAFLYKKNQASHSNEHIVFYTSDGDSIKTIEIPDSISLGVFVKDVPNGCMLAGRRLWEIDTLLTLKNLGPFLSSDDSIEITECTLSKTGRIFGSGSYWGGSRVGMDLQDMCFFMSDRQKSMSGQVKFLNTGISEDHKPKPNIEIFPNPFSTWLNIKTREEIRSVRIYDLNGKLVYNGWGKSVNVSELNQGFYTVRIFYGKDDTAFLTHKLIKE